MKQETPYLMCLGVSLHPDLIDLLGETVNSEKKGDWLVSGLTFLVNEHSVHHYKNSCGESEYLSKLDLVICTFLDKALPPKIRIQIQSDLCVYDSPKGVQILLNPSKGYHHV